MDGIDATSVIANRGLNLGYGYGSQGNFLGDGSAVKEAVRGNRDLSLLESVNRGSSDQFITDRINTGHAALSEQIREQHTSDRFATIERLMLQQNTDAQRDRTDTLLAIADVKCCCEANSAKIDGLAALNAKDLQIQTLTLELAACRAADSRPGNS